MNLQLLAAIAAIGGAATALQAHFMGLMDKRVGTMESVFITYFGGGVLIGLIMLFQRGGNMAAAAALPWYAYTSGALGLVIVGTLAYSTPRLGLVAAFTIFVSAQFAMGALVDHFGWMGSAVRPLTAARLVGMAVVLIGLWLIIRE
jgi:bacterial/archaeal transporter family-2 protein